MPFNLEDDATTNPPTPRVEPVALTKFKVKMFEVDALDVKKLDEVPNKVAILALVAVKVEIIAEVRLASVVKKLVDVELVIVPLVAVRFVGLRVAIERLVIVALVNVAFIADKFAVVVAEIIRPFESTVITAIPAAVVEP